MFIRANLRDSGGVEVNGREFNSVSGTELRATPVAILVVQRSGGYRSTAIKTTKFKKIIDDAIYNWDDMEKIWNDMEKIWRR